MHEKPADHLLADPIVADWWHDMCAERRRRERPGPRRVAGRDGARELLLSLNDDIDDDRLDAVHIALEGMGEVTAELIMDEWDDLSLEHRRVGIGYVGYGRSAQVVPFLLSILPDVVDDELDFQAWCSSARPHPDERIVDAMRPHVEPLALVDVAYCFAAQCALLGIDRPELGFARWRTEHSLASEAARRQRTDGEI